MPPAFFCFGCCDDRAIPPSHSLRWNLVNHLSGLALNCNPPNISLPSSRIIGISHWHPAKTHNFHRIRSWIWLWIESLRHLGKGCIMKLQKSWEWVIFKSSINKDNAWVVRNIND
jgi:hypothetical protein